VQRRVAEHEAFHDEVLPSMGANSGQEPISLLNQGPDTSAVYKRAMVEYTGLIPGSKRLGQLRRAQQHIDDAIASWAPAEA